MKRRYKIGFTAGTWDFVHAGHVLHFKECKQHCDYLIVGLQTDPSVRKGKNKPVMSLEERYIMLKANKWVDAVMVYDEEDEVYNWDFEMPIDVRFMGEDHKGNHHSIRAEVIYTKRDHEYSSTNLRKKINSSGFR